MTPHLHEGCLEGTKRAPRGFESCCSIFADHLRACAYDVRYEFSEQHGWGIRIADEAGGGAISIAYCPHCGVRLRNLQSVRNSVWFEIVVFGSVLVLLIVGLLLSESLEIP